MNQPQLDTRGPLTLPYSKTFFTNQKPGSLQSAKEVVPLVVDLLHPSSVADVGCGVGTWLSVFREHGIQDCLGIDGDYVDRDLLLFPKDKFLAHDLTRPIETSARFDLVVSLEVGEHLPASCAGTFVDSLTSLGPVVLFSAAIPHQGGTRHINEQWQEYWCDLFEQRGYAPVDYLRRRIWRNPRVVWFYAQNTLLYVERTHLAANPRLLAESERTNTSQISIVHPRALTNFSLRSALSLCASAAQNSFRRRLVRRQRRRRPA